MTQTMIFTFFIFLGGLGLELRVGDTHPRPTFEYFPLKLETGRRALDISARFGAFGKERNKNGAGPGR